MDSQKRRSAVEEDMDHDGENQFVDNASILNDNSSGNDSPTQEQSVDYSAMDSFQEQRGRLRLDTKQRQPRGNQQLPNHVSIIQQQSEQVGAEGGRTYTNPDGMASRSVTHPRSTRLREQLHL